MQRDRPPAAECRRSEEILRARLPTSQSAELLQSLIALNAACGSGLTRRRQVEFSEFVRPDKPVLISKVAIGLNERKFLSETGPTGDELIVMEKLDGHLSAGYSVDFAGHVAGIVRSEKDVDGRLFNGLRWTPEKR
jgi:hypothetical protein